MSDHTTKLEYAVLKDSGATVQIPIRVQCMTCTWFSYDPKLSESQLRQRGRDHTWAKREGG